MKENQYSSYTGAFSIQVTMKMIECRILINNYKMMEYVTKVLACYSVSLLLPTCADSSRWLRESITIQSLNSLENTANCSWYNSWSYRKSAILTYTANCSCYNNYMYTTRKSAILTYEKQYYMMYMTWYRQVGRKRNMIKHQVWTKLQSCFMRVHIIWIMAYWYLFCRS